MENLPVLLSLFNPQSLVTPADYTSGTVLNERKTGTGAWMLEDFDPSSFRAKFVPNPNWWGGNVNLDSVVLQGFDDGGTKVAAMAAGEIDVIQDFSVNDGANLLTDENITVLTPPSANHRQLWFNTQLPSGGPFTDPRVRQAVGFAIDRQQIVDTIYEGQALIANDHPVYPTLPYFDATQEQRTVDQEKARQLLSDAGYPDGIESTLQVGDIGEVPQIAAIVQANLAEIGIDLKVSVTPNSDFYGEYWCPGASYGTDPESAGPGIPCGASADIGIVDYGHGQLLTSISVVHSRPTETGTPLTTIRLSSTACSRITKRQLTSTVRRPQLVRSNVFFTKTCLRCTTRSSTTCRATARR